VWPPHESVRIIYRRDGARRATRRNPIVIETRELFAQHNLRCTRQRVAVYEALCECKCHPTAEQLFQLVKPRTDKLSLATVYNALEALCTAELVRRMPTTNGSCRYDADTSEHLHVRFPSTAEIEDVPRDLGSKLTEQLPQDVIEEIEAAMGIKIDAVSVQLLASRRPQPGQ
jgi:Fe2+ or Zn2+ uptake regulation protein